MALFKKKKKNEDIDTDKELDEFAIVDDEDDIFSSESPAPGYDDDDDLEDYLDNDIDNPENQKDSKEPISKVKFIGILAGVIILVLFLLNVTGVLDVSSGENTNSDQTQSQEEGNNDSGENPKNNGEGIIVNEAVGESYVGKDDGNPMNGTGAILAFTYDYYTTRNGEKARQHFNPDATSYDAKYIQNNIDNNPEGTSYNLKITPRVVGSTYDGELTVTPPGASSGQTFNILYEVMEKDGTYYIKTFEQQSSNDK